MPPRRSSRAHSAADIIPISGKLKKDFTDSSEYRAAVVEAQDVVQKFADELFSAALTLATNGDWRAWSDSQPVGTIMAFTVADLLEVEDPRVHLLASTVETLESVFEELEIED